MPVKFHPVKPDKFTSVNTSNLFLYDVLVRPFHQGSFIPLNASTDQHLFRLLMGIRGQWLDQLRRLDERRWSYITSPRGFPLKRGTYLENCPPPLVAVRPIMHACNAQMLCPFCHARAALATWKRCAANLFGKRTKARFDAFYVTRQLRLPADRMAGWLAQRTLRRQRQRKKLNALGLLERLELAPDMVDPTISLLSLRQLWILPQKSQPRPGPRRKHYPRVGLHKIRQLSARVLQYPVWLLQPGLPISALIQTLDRREGLRCTTVLGLLRSAAKPPSLRRRKRKT